MRTSLNEIREVERFLLDKMRIGESLVFQAKMITDARLRVNVASQKRLMALVRLYHRRSVKKDLQVIHRNLLHSNERSDFQLLIRSIFRS